MGFRSYAPMAAQRLNALQPRAQQDFSRLCLLGSSAEISRLRQARMLEDDSMPTRGSWEYILQVTQSSGYSHCKAGDGEPYCSLDLSICFLFLSTRPASRA